MSDELAVVKGGEDVAMREVPLPPVADVIAQAGCVMTEDLPGIAGRRRRLSILRTGVRRMAAPVIHELVGRPAPLSSPGSPPSLIGVDDWWASLSHAWPYVAFAIARRPVGIDVESLNRRFDEEMLRAAAFGSQEFSGMNRGAVLRSWTLKEATLKAMRCGLRVSPRDVVTRDERLYDLPPGWGDAQRWRTMTCTNGGAVVSVAVAPAGVEPW